MSAIFSVGDKVRWKVQTLPNGYVVTMPATVLSTGRKVSTIRLADMQQKKVRTSELLADEKVSKQ